MKVMWKRIGDHLVHFHCLDGKALWFFNKMFADRPAAVPHGEEECFKISMRQGGEPNHGVNTITSRDRKGRLKFERPDYRLVMSTDFSEAEIVFYDYIGLRCVLMNWYSAVIGRQNWGLVVHSSTIIHNGAAHLFAGVSGAGKTTVASLSLPRELLADEASIVKLPPEGQVVVYDSPMRSGLLTPASVSHAPLHAIYLLKQSSVIRKQRLPGSEALLSLFNKILYWPQDMEESSQVVRMCKSLVERVPVYQLEFQKNNLFWGAL